MTYLLYVGSIIIMATICAIFGMRLNEQDLYVTLLALAILSGAEAIRLEMK